MRTAGTFRRWQGSGALKAVPGPNGGCLSIRHTSNGRAAFRRRWAAVSEPVNPAPTMATRDVSCGFIPVFAVSPVGSGGWRAIIVRCEPHVHARSHTRPAPWDGVRLDGP